VRDNVQLQPLKGIKVVDFCHAWAGPACTALLSDAGADTIKVEPITGDFFRTTMGGAVFINVNRNKRGIALNLKTEEGRRIALKLLESADVLVENFVPGVMDRLGLGYETISRVNPRIIYCSISGFGQKGPYHKRPSFDPVAQAVSGIMLATGEPGRPPVRILPPMIDYSAGIHGAYGIIIALLNREKTGNGERIDISLMDIGIVQMSAYVTYYTMTGELPERMGSAHKEWAPYQAFETSDGWVLIAVSSNKMWKNLCKVLGLKDLRNDSRYATTESRRKHRKDLAESLTKVTRQYRARELESMLSEAGVPCGQLRDIGEVVNDPHVKARHLIDDVENPGLGEIKIVRTPIFFSGQALKARSQAPQLGEHTAEVLAELGYSEADIQRLEDDGIVCRKSSMMHPTPQAMREISDDRKANS
jgi:crotonobetainyl-CoA:carnitine CoA-transferase CaiB-like acyl-CoA transferase